MRRSFSRETTPAGATAKWRAAYEAAMNDDWRRTWHALRPLLGAKWSLHVLRALSDGAYGFNELKREIDGATATMLSRRLQELACHGLVERSVEETTPPTTTYRLTERGRKFAATLEELESLVEVVEPPREDEQSCATAQAGCATVAPRQCCPQ